MVRESTIRRQHHLEEIAASILVVRFDREQISTIDDLFVIKTGTSAIYLHVQPTRRRLPAGTLRAHQRLRSEGFEVRTVHSVVEIDDGSCRSEALRMNATKSAIARPTDEQLAHLYLELGLGCPDIGRMFGRDPKTVLAWLRAARIQTRPRGFNAAINFPKGAPGSFTGHRHTPEAIAKIGAASRARGAVPYLRDGKHWLKGAPPETNPRWLGGATPERQEFYRSAEWKAAVKFVWQRDDACCRNCGKDWRTVDRSVEKTFHIHHVWSFQIRELRANPAILVLLCRPCHLWTHSNANVTRAWLPQDTWENLPSLGDLATGIFDLLGGEAA